MKDTRGKGTFVIRVEYTQNNSWQGSVTWTEQNKTECFRSALELLQLVDNALAGTCTQHFQCLPVSSSSEEENTLQEESVQ